MGKLLFGGLFILGGLSGDLVLKGTQSSGALVVVGVLLVLWGLVQLGRRFSSE